MANTHLICEILATGAAICGNQVVEEGEQCDCGFKDDCADDKCCNDAESKDGCKLKAGVQCSPSQGLCCEKDTCQFSNDSKICDDGECINNTYCNSTSAVCPTPIPMPDNKTDCNEGKSVCLAGVNLVLKLCNAHILTDAMTTALLCSSSNV